MDLDHALHIFRLYYHLLGQDESQAETMLLTDGEKEAIAKIQKVIVECWAPVAGKSGPATARAQ
jgi:hypothetical protein